MPELRDELREAAELLKAGRAGEAAERGEALIRRYPRSPDVRMLNCGIAQQLGQFERMLAHAEQALALAPGNAAVQFRVLECLLYCGQADLVIGRLRRLESEAGDDHPLLAKIAEYYTHCTKHLAANRCYRRAVDLQPSNTEYLFSLAASLTATGALDEAEAVLTRVIELNPHDYDAYRNRSTLRKQTADDNHIDEILARLQEGVKRPAGEAQLCYALAKEYEDLGAYRKAFRFLKRGADKRRGLMAYRVESDLEAIEKIIAVFSKPLFARAASGCAECGPVFVVGLPRSGTTLVDRILSSHSRVASLGEINDLAYALMRTIGSGGGKLDLIAKSAGIDFATPGQRYVESTRGYGVEAEHLIDKTPLNYLYIGLIRLALPGARIVHIRRDPMDSCYGMYRTLFRSGYPFSYDFDDLARYYIAYWRLMNHWQAVVPDAFLDVRYEELVNDQGKVSRRIVDYCGLEWEPDCLGFQTNAAPVATASAAQVRRPLYRDAIGRWRHYERQLEPLMLRLNAAGIGTEAET